MNYVYIYIYTHTFMTFYECMIVYIITKIRALLFVYDDTSDNFKGGCVTTPSGWWLKLYILTYTDMGFHSFPQN